MKIKSFKSIKNNKIKLNTKMSLYFGITAILLGIMFLGITRLVINTSFDKYKVEDDLKNITFVKEYIENIYENNGEVKEQDIKVLKPILPEGIKVIEVDDKKENVIFDSISDINPNIIDKEELDSEVLVSKYPMVIDNATENYINIEQTEVPILSIEDVRFKSRLYTQLAITALIGVFITILIGSFLSKQISKPILKIKDTADILSNGELSARVNIETDTKEIEALNSSINYLAESLENQEILRKRLTADVSHELRTPLNVLQNQIEAMSDGIFEASPERLQICHNEIIRLTGLIKDLEQLTNIEKDNKEQLNKENTSLTKLIKEVIFQFESVFSEKNMNVNFSYIDDVKAHIDKNQIKQVLINILSNANKFTDIDGSINVKLYKENEIACIEVKDDGMGIDEEDLPHIFERFYRVENSRNRKTGGTGIGLSIARGIIEGHKGKIYALSKKNVGTTVVIEIPI